MIDKLKNWKEVTMGLYRYVVAAKLAYEIHIIYWDDRTDLSTATARLYLVGEWMVDGRTELTRECLSPQTSVETCLKLAKEDAEEYHYE